jgi:ATP-binding cassette subfamily B protein
MVRAADEIVVLEHGRVVERGRHEALLGHGGIYARLHAIQNGTAGTAGAPAHPSRPVTPPQPVARAREVIR